jgi:hypothetical protein
LEKNIALYTNWRGTGNVSIHLFETGKTACCGLIFAETFKGILFAFSMNDLVASMNVLDSGLSRD